MELEQIKNEITRRLEMTHPTEHHYLVTRDKNFTEMIENPSLNKTDIKELKKFAYQEVGRINQAYSDAGIVFKMPSSEGIDFPDLSEGKNPHPIATEVNVHYALSNFGKFEFQYDRFTEVYGVREKSIKPQKWRGLTLPEVKSAIQMHLNRLSQWLRVQDNTILTVCRHLCEQNIIDSGLEVFTKEKWDGTERLARWLSIVTGQDDDFVASAGEQWIQALAMRQIQPGFKFDHMLVISGPQGTRKTTMFEVLAGDFYKQVIGKPEGNDWFAKAKGSLIIDMDEGRALTLTDVNYMKGLISARKDIQRGLYSQDDRERWRRFVIGMTTNASQFLRDSTGNRRYLVIFIEKTLDIDWLVENRTQLFAEAYHRCINGIAPSQINLEEAENRQREAFESDEITNEIEKYLMTHDIKYRNGDMSFTTTVYEIYCNVLYKGLTPDLSKYTRKVQREISEALQDIGLEKGKRKRAGGNVTTTWVMTERLSERLKLKEDPIVEWKNEMPENATMQVAPAQLSLDDF